MEQLIIKQTEDTPGFTFIPDKEIFKIIGSSLPENPKKFYDRVITWLEEYFKNPKPTNVFEFKLDYINTSSCRQLAKLLILLKENETVINIKWFYETADSYIFSMGQRYSALTDIKFEFIEY